MKIAFLMDPLETVKAYKDTTYYLMLAASERGNEVFYFNQYSMQAGNAGVTAAVELLNVRPSIEHPFDVLDRGNVDLSTMDAIVVRTDPPFDRSYLYSTLLLDLIGSDTVVVNRPSGIRNWNEKLAAMLYPDFTPATLISNETKEILKFVNEYERVTIKPVDGHGGKGIFFWNRATLTMYKKLIRFQKTETTGSSFRSTCRKLRKAISEFYCLKGNQSGRYCGFMPRAWNLTIWIRVAKRLLLKWMTETTKFAVQSNLD